MSASARYAVWAVGLLSLVTLALVPVLDPASRAGVVRAALIALPVQIVAFDVLRRRRKRLEHFLAAWMGGTAVRALVVAATALVVVRAEVEGAVALLLALPGFFLVLVLLEPLFFAARDGERVGRA